MKIIYKFVTVLTTFFIVAFNFSCGPKTIVSDPTNCFPEKINLTNPQATAFNESVELTYDGSDRIQYIRNSRLTTLIIDTVFYNGNLVQIKSIVNNKTYFLNANGLADSSRSILLNTNPSFPYNKIQTTEVYTFDSEKHIIKVNIYEKFTDNSNNVLFDTIKNTYSYSNGNLNTLTVTKKNNPNENYSVTLNNNGSKQYNYGYINYDFNTMNYPFLGIRSEKLLASAVFTGGKTGTFNYTYESEKNGNVLKQIESDMQAKTRTITISYPNCN